MSIIRVTSYSGYTAFVTNVSEPIDTGEGLSPIISVINKREKATNYFPEDAAKLLPEIRKCYPDAAIDDEEEEKCSVCGEYLFQHKGPCAPTSHLNEQIIQLTKERDELRREVERWRGCYNDIVEPERKDYESRMAQLEQSNLALKSAMQELRHQYHCGTGKDMLNIINHALNSTPAPENWIRKEDAAMDTKRLDWLEVDFRTNGDKLAKWNTETFVEFTSIREAIDQALLSTTKGSQ